MNDEKEQEMKIFQFIHDNLDISCEGGIYPSEGMVQTITVRLKHPITGDMVKVCQAEIY